MKKTIALFFCLIVGSIHLFIYCHTSEIPIPLDIMTTSSIILIFGISTIFTSVSIVLTSCILLPFVSMFQHSKIYCEINKGSSDKVTNPLAGKKELETLIQNIKNYTFLFSSTIATLAMLTYLSYHSKTPIGVGLFLSILFIEILTSSLLFQLYLLSRHRIKNYLYTFNIIEMHITRLLVFLCVAGVKFAWLLSMTFAVAWALKIFKIEDNIAIAALLILTTIANCIFLTANKQPTSFQKTAEIYSKRGFFIRLLKESHPLSILAILFILILSLFHPSIVKETSAATLKMLKIGGGVELVYYFNRNNIEDFPKETIDSCTLESTCRTKKLNIIMDIGKTLYAGNDNLVYALPREKLQLILTQKISAGLKRSE